jgi:hypothetical protein
MKATLKYPIAGMLCLTLSLMGIDSCKNKKEPDATPDTESSFSLIQQKVLNPSCAVSGCHASESDVAFAQHRLVLAEGVAYGNLVDADPQNAAAKNDGMKRVKPGKTNQSFLLHKLTCDLNHHSSDYGNPMPLGLDPLSAGQIEYISQWIAAGASAKGKIAADVRLLDDNVPSCAEAFTPLEAPAFGYQLKIESFEIPAKFEREIFVYKEVGNEEEAYINRFEMKMRRNSHHFLVNTFRPGTPTLLLPAVNQVRELRNAGGNYVQLTTSQMAFQDFAMASQAPVLDYHFPPGVALKIPARHKLDLNLHYVNRSDKTIPGECYMNLHQVQPSEVQHEAQPIFWDNTNFSLLALKKTLVTKSFTAQQPMKIFMLTSHTHQLGEQFDIKIKGGSRNGELIYTSTTWHHPLIKTFATPVELKAGEGLTMEITYNNTTNKTVSFGLTSQDEMGIIYGYYY